MSNAQRVFLSDVDRTDPHDLLMRLEPFLGIAHRTTAVFDILNNCLVSLHSTKNEPFGQNVLPVNYTFFKNEFRRFCEEASTDDEVATIIDETCKALEALKQNTAQLDASTQRKSIVDPLPIKMTGSQSTKTSARVDRQVVPQRTKLVDTHQTKTLQRTTKPRGDKRRHKCRICLDQGHHARTCNDILLPEQSDRANAFLKELVDSNKQAGFLSSFARRAGKEAVAAIVERLKAVEDA